MNFAKDFLDIIREGKKPIVIMYYDDFKLKHGLLFCVKKDNVNSSGIIYNLPAYVLKNSSYFFFIQEKTPKIFLKLLIKNLLTNYYNVHFFNTDFTQEQMEVIRFYKFKYEDKKEQYYNKSKKNYPLFFYNSYLFSLKSVELLYNMFERDTYLGKIYKLSDEQIQKNKENVMHLCHVFKETVTTNPDLVYVVPDGIIPSLQSLILAQHFDNKNIEEVREKYFFNSDINDQNLETTKAPSNLPEISHKRHENPGYIVK